MLVCSNDDVQQSYKKICKQRIFGSKQKTWGNNTVRIELRNHSRPYPLARCSMRLGMGKLATTLLKSGRGSVLVIHGRRIQQPRRDHLTMQAGAFRWAGEDGRAWCKDGSFVCFWCFLSGAKLRVLSNQVKAFREDLGFVFARPFRLSTAIHYEANWPTYLYLLLVSVEKLKS